jgi:hypothetical protein
MKCYNFLFFQAFLRSFTIAQTHKYSLVFILHEFLEEQYDPLISIGDSIKGECYG